MKNALQAGHNDIPADRLGWSNHYMSWVDQEHSTESQSVAVPRTVLRWIKRLEIGAFSENREIVSVVAAPGP